MTTGPQYRRLPGRSGLFIRNSLWMGADHLLRVRRNPFSESYRRYYFADIQAIVVTELSNAAEPYGYTAAALLILTAGVLVYTRHPVWGCVCGLIALAAFYASWRSANCACYIETSISAERLASLRRHRDAAKAVALLKPEIEKAQGRVNPEMLVAHVPDARTTRVSTLQPVLRHCGGQVHWLVFALMLVRGVIGAISWQRFQSSFALNIAASIVSTVILILLVLAAIQQRDSDLALGNRRLVYVTLAWYIASGLAGFAVGIYVAYGTARLRVAGANLIANPAMRAYGVFDLAGYFVLGCTGLILMWRHQRSFHTPPPLALGNGG